MKVGVGKVTITHANGPGNVARRKHSEAQVSALVLAIVTIIELLHTSDPHAQNGSMLLKTLVGLFKQHGKCPSQPPACINPPSVALVKSTALVSSVPAVILEEK